MRFHCPARYYLRFNINRFQLLRHVFAGGREAFDAFATLQTCISDAIICVYDGGGGAIAKSTFSGFSQNLHTICIYDGGDEGIARCVISVFPNILSAVCVFDGGGEAIEGSDISGFSQNQLFRTSETTFPTFSYFSYFFDVFGIRITLFFEIATFARTVGH